MYISPVVHFPTPVFPHDFQKLDPRGLALSTTTKIAVEILSDTTPLNCLSGTNNSSEHIHLNMTWVKEDDHNNS